MKTTTVYLEKYSYGGESFGRLDDNRAIFVPFTIPGECVEIKLVEEKKGYARGELIDVVEPSSFRIEPLCPHFTQCGGCHYQHLPYERQLQAKEEIIRDQLLRIGKIEDPQLLPIVPSPTPWYYRNHVQFHITSAGELGYQGPRTHKTIPILECHLPDQTIIEIWPRLDIESIPGLDRVGLRVGVDNHVLISLESSDPEPVELSVDLPLSVVQSGPRGHLVLAGDDYIMMEVADRVFQVSAGSFFQVNNHLAAAMVQYILNNLSISQNSTLIDAYCGVGLFSAFLAPLVNRLVAIETSPTACEDFIVNLDQFDNVELYQDSVGNVLHTLDKSPGTIIVDPPRTGLDHPAIDGILYLEPDTIVYVSCDPATLSRDVRRLSKGGYHLFDITPFDLFPQTYHIESISIFKKV